MKFSRIWFYHGRNPTQNRFTRETDEFSENMNSEILPPTTHPSPTHTHLWTNFFSVTLLKNPKFLTKRWKTQKHLAKVHIVGIIEVFLSFNNFIISCFAKRSKYFTRIISALPKHTRDDQKPKSLSSELLE